MLATIISDVYGNNEANQVAEALDDLCCPKDIYGWSSAGIYCFWNPVNNKILYIGLSVDLTLRFRQHNGLMKMDKGGCKNRQIKDYFQHADKLGYSIFVQSPLSQTANHRYLQEMGDYFTDDHRELFEQGHDEIIIMEGLLIKAEKIRNGQHPPWNKVGGSVVGQKISYSNIDDILDYLRNSKDSPLLARTSIREISNNPTYGTYEELLHGVRFSMLRRGKSFKDSFDDLQDSAGTKSRIIKNNYLAYSVIGSKPTTV
jgi:hypothetical protein